MKNMAPATVSSSGTMASAVPVTKPLIDVGVVRQQRQRVALAALVEERQRQRLQVIVDADLEVGDDALRSVAEVIRVAELEQRLHGEQRQKCREDSRDAPAGVAGATQQGLCQFAAEPRDGQRRSGLQQHQQRAQRQCCSVRRGVGKQGRRSDIVYGAVARPRGTAGLARIVLKNRRRGTIGTVRSARLPSVRLAMQNPAGSRPASLGR